MPPLIRTTALLLPVLASPAALSDSDPGAKIAAQGTPRGVAPCMSCHGADGGGMAPTAYPRLAGLNAGYLAKQLRDFRAGKRSNPVMMPMAKNLTDEEVAAVSAYYAAMAIPATVAKPPAAEVAKIATDLAQWGDWTGRGLPACTQCHATNGGGVGASFPGIGGQQAGYIKAQLSDWKAGTRANDPLGLMKAVADRLTDAEIDALAAFYAAQPGAAPVQIGDASATAANDAHKAPTKESSNKEAPEQGGSPSAPKADATGDFKPPARDDLPDGPFGKVVRQGQDIFLRTNTDSVSAEYVGNDQVCGNCHIDAGRLANSAPLWAAWVAYPAYRSKNKKVNTYIQRLQGCFTYSMNAQASVAGAAPAADSDAIVSLVAYSYWLAKGAPTGDATMPGRGFPPLNETVQGFDPERGAAVYAAKCALCHGPEGAGVMSPDGRAIFPPLWGPNSYNWGAGMHKIDTAAAFIKQNMPLGLSDFLSDQEAWDVAAYVNSHERPQDPRHKGDLAATTKEHHGSKFDYYGKYEGADGKLLGESSPNQTDNSRK